MLWDFYALNLRDSYVTEGWCTSAFFEVAGAKKFSDKRRKMKDVCFFFY